MFTSLLVGLDGSVQAQVALAQAIEIGKRFRARVVIAHVVRTSAFVTKDRIAGAPWMEWASGALPGKWQDIEAATREMLDDAAGAVRKAGLEVEVVLRNGAVVEALRELAQAVGVVVVGRVGVRGGGGTDPLGPDTRDLITRSPRPVVVAGTEPSPMDRCLVAYGSGNLSGLTLEFAARYAAIAGSHLDILHVSDDDEIGRGVLARAAQALSRAQMSFETHLAGGAIDQAVAAAVKRLSSNALFVGARREDGRWLVPSHAEAILRATDIPVVVNTQPVAESVRVSGSYRPVAPG